jgi:Domain of unknown function (DUF4398)
MRGVCQTISIAVILAAVSVAGCASKGVPPVESMTSAELVIKEAKDNNATINAPLELKFAEDKLAAAKALVAKEEFFQAKRLADEAFMDAKFAEAKSLSVKAQKQAQEMRETIETLRHEIDRIQSQKQ